MLFRSDTMQWIDGNGDNVAEVYYFDEEGYILSSTTLWGLTFNADGMLVDNGVVQQCRADNRDWLWRWDQESYSWYLIDENGERTTPKIEGGYLKEGKLYMDTFFLDAWSEAPDQLNTNLGDSCKAEFIHREGFNLNDYEASEVLTNFAKDLSKQIAPEEFNGNRGQQVYHFQLPLFEGYDDAIPRPVMEEVVSEVADWILPDCNWFVWVDPNNTFHMMVYFPEDL